MRGAEVGHFDGGSFSKSCLVLGGRFQIKEHYMRGDLMNFMKVVQSNLFLREQCR